ncbi:MAG: S46 family peptidase, partial [Pirellulaceae bacterium]|nr:S46 family peptidase [Pirellulaceae bacterium]
MNVNSLLARIVTLLVALGAIGASASADEGMWLFNALPKKHLKEAHNFEPTEAWSKHVMLSSVRFNSGGSASFVSSTGLVLTNHHVGAGTLHKVSTAENNYYRDGFYATSWDKEIAAPDLELNQLVSIENVTERVNTAVKPGMAPGEAFAARRAVTSEIEKESLDGTGLRSDVATLYGGARYHLYRYKKYTDVRLVWAPEAGIAFFGGDADNFEYPRYCLDVCIFRVYEDGKPARTDNFLKMSKNGAADGELVFVSGNPGRTQRIFTTAALKYQRDHYLPYVL